MNTNEIINALRQMDNQNLLSSKLPWQKTLFASATIVNSAINGRGEDIMQYLQTMTPVCLYDDPEKSYFFGLIPISDRQWRFFVLDRFRNQIARMEDYKGTIRNNATQPPTPITTAFLLKIIP